MEGGSSGDHVFGAGTLLGGRGSDLMEPFDDSTADGGPGKDILITVGLVTHLSGGGGVDTLWANPSGAFGAKGIVMDIGAGMVDLGELYDNWVVTFDGFEKFWGSQGDDLIIGSSGNDRINGREGSDEIHGRGGNDILRGDGGLFLELDGDDTIFGEKGDDTLFGRDGDDNLDGGPGTDTGDEGNGVNTCISIENPTNC